MKRISFTAFSCTMAFVGMMMLFALPTAFSATLSGTTYDIGLSKISPVRVEINTTPKQVFIAKDGTYSFSLPPGFYALKAFFNKDGSPASFFQENVSILQEGNYNLDLVLFPSFPDDEMLDEISVNPEEGIQDARKIGWLWLIPLAIILVVELFIWRRRKNEFIKALEKDKGKYGLEKNESSERDGEKDSFGKSELTGKNTLRGKNGLSGLGNRDGEKIGLGDDTLGEVLSIIKKEGGRTTQKEIRKQVPLSEAKISLILTELEHEGRIKKIKKGRGNVVVLKTLGVSKN